MALILCQINCNFFNHFPCMYVGLIVKDECERSVKNQASKVEQVDFATSLRQSREKQPSKRVTCRAHD